MKNKNIDIINWFKSKNLLFVVFFTGACLLILELVATRMLSPYYGNTIFTVTSVIGVVLAALSFGYYFGGIYADKNPRKEKFYRLIFYSGIAVLSTQIINLFLIPQIAFQFSLKSGPLITSILLFMLPSYLLGMLSPFAIKLQEIANKKDGIGKLSGEIFFASTFGSIFGTFLAGYYLIPTFGLQNIVIAVGVALCLLGLLYNFKFSNKFISLITFIALLLLSFLKESSLKGQVYVDDGIYEKVAVIETLYKGKPTRILLQDASFGSGVFVNETEEMAFDYTNYYKLYHLLEIPPKNILFIGGGAYTMPNRLAQELTDVNIEVTEIEPQLLEVAKKYFRYKDTDKIKNYITDGRRFLHDTNQKYDIIFSDVYSSLYSIPPHFTTKEFFELARSRLSNDGMLIANIIGDLSRQSNSILLTEVKTFKEVFPNSNFFAVDSPIKNGSQNFIFVGLKNERDLLKSVENHDDEFLKSIAGKNIDIKRFNLSDYSTLTDDYAPVEILTAGLLSRLENTENTFSGDEALAVIDSLLRFGPRYVGSEGKTKAAELINAEMKALNNDTLMQTWENEDKAVFTNIISRFNKESSKKLILATHYDSKKFANLDENKVSEYVPGANDSASSVAVLMELASVLANSPDKPNIGIDFVFFDGEEGVEGEEWKPEGSTYFTQNIKSFYSTEKLMGAIVIDMVCDKDLNIFEEQNSFDNAAKFNSEVFAIANNLYPKNFHQQTKYRIEDDHMPLNEAGIPSILLIDFDYPYFHTTKDKIDKCSAESLEKVGNVLLKYLYSF